MDQLGIEINTAESILKVFSDNGELQFNANYKYGSIYQVIEDFKFY